MAVVRGVLSLVQKSPAIATALGPSSSPSSSSSLNGGEVAIRNAISSGGVSVLEASTTSLLPLTRAASELAPLIPEIQPGLQYMATEFGRAFTRRVLQRLALVAGAGGPLDSRVSTTSVTLDAIRQGGGQQRQQGGAGAAAGSMAFAPRGDGRPSSRQRPPAPRK